jgi:indole-3-glycerol phosphate synthase
MPTIIDRILESKRAEVEQAKRARPFSEVLAAARDAAPVRDFVGALRTKVSAGLPAVIAEIKRASPSAGTFRIAEGANFDPARIAASYATHGAACLSVLTDREFFGGSAEDLMAARAACALPVLRKDFVVDPYQIAEARAMGADAVLFIMGACPIAAFQEWEGLAEELNLAVLAESHNAEQLMHALSLKTPLIGVNNRDLARFVTDTNLTLALKPMVPEDRLLVSESGIDTPEIAEAMVRQGVHAFLIGGAFMASGDPGKALENHFDWSHKL